jgi:hypothetical protein
MMDVLRKIVTILNLCSVQFYGIFDSSTSLHQFPVPAAIAFKEIHNNLQNTTELRTLIQSTIVSQKCPHSGTGIIAFISVNDRSTNSVREYQLQSEFMLNRYEPLLKQVSLYSNPAFILLQINETFRKSHLIFDWLTLPITSQLLLFNAEAIYSPNVNVGPSLRVALDNRSMIRSIKSFWKAKLNLMGRFIHLMASVSEIQIKNLNISDCSLNLDKLRSPPDICVLVLLQKQINFTIHQTQTGRKPNYFLLKLFNGISDNNVNNFIITKKQPGFQWLTHGVKFNPYKLTLITKLQRVNVDSLLQPFHWNMWVTLLVANCLFFILVCIGSRFKKKCKLILWMISTIFSQPDECLTISLFDKKRMINLGLVSSWFFFMFLLNVLYQGDLYSCLSNVRLPVLPNSLSEALAINIPLFTSGIFCPNSVTMAAKRLKIPCSSTLLDKLIPDILNLNATHDNLRKVAVKVLNRTENLGYAPVLIAADMAFQPDKLQYLNSTWVPTETYGLLTSSEDTDLFGAGAKVFFKDHIIRQTSDVNPFITVKPWMAVRGPFATAFSSGVGSLSQSGLLERWRKYADIGQAIRVIKVMFKSMDDLENKFVDKEELLTQEQLANRSLEWEGSGRLYSRLMLVPDKISMFVSGQSVAFEVMKLPFLVCLVLISVATVVFLIEYVTSKLMRSKINHSPLSESTSTLYRKIKQQKVTLLMMDLLLCLMNYGKKRYSKS